MWEEFQSIFRLGMLHIADGTDHLLFLLTLILSAVKPSAKFKETGLQLAKLVTAFTIGHSLSLLIGTYQWINWSPQPIEVGIACTILLSAVNLIWPIWQGREVYVVTVFGLIHGLAFAGLMIELGSATSILFMEILGFNLGIEFLQIVVLVMVVPLLLIIAKGPWYHSFRKVSAGVCMTAASLWLLERLGVEMRWFSAIEWRLNHWLALMFVILVFAGISFKFRDKNRPTV